MSKDSSVSCGKCEARLCEWRGLSERGEALRMAINPCNKYKKVLAKDREAVL